MKNEVKLNIHMFFPEMQNDEISAEKHAVLEKLINLSPVDAKDSVEKFIAELESRLALIKPILGDQTEELLGYKQEDIDILSKFFSRKFLEGNKEALAATCVQMILKKIWLQTPCEDKRLNYDLYKFIDEKFYEINDSYKRIFSFNNWEAGKKIEEIFIKGVSLQALKIDWEMRKKRYGEFLSISDEYLNEELFLSPTVTVAEEYAAIEFLNFWMPYLCQCPFGDIVISDKYIHEAIDSTDNKSNIEKLIYVKHVRFVNIALQESKDDIYWLIPYKKYFSVLADRFAGWEVVNKKILNEEFDKIIYGAINKLDELVNTEDVQQNVEMFARESKKIIYEHIKPYFRDVQQTHFGPATKLVQPSLFDFLPSLLIFTCLYDNEEFYGDLQQLPRFINPHKKYFIYDRLVRVVRPDDAFCSEGKNYFYPDRYIPDMLLEYDKLFTALNQHIDGFCEGENLQTALNYFTSLNEFLEIHYENLVLPKALKNAKGEWIDYVKNMIGNRRNQILVALAQCYYFFRNDTEITPAAKQELLYAIGEYFNKKVKIFGINIPQNIATICADINQDFESFSEKNKLPDIAKLRLCNELKYICDRDKFNREQEKKNIELARMQERIDFFNELCHEMGGLSTVVKARIDDSQERLLEVIPPINQNTLMHLNIANQGAYVLSQYTRTFTLSSRRLDDNWRDDLNAKHDAKRMRDILWQAFYYSISHVFFRDINRFFHARVSQNYFTTKDEMLEAKKEWGNLDTRDDQFAWIQQCLFNFTWQDNVSALDIMIGDNHSIQTHLFVLFYEIFLNAIKAISYAEKEQRYFTVNFLTKDDYIFVEMCNSVGQESLGGYGQGNHIIQAYMDKFNISDFYTNSDGSIYTMSFSLPFLSNGEK